MIANLANMKVIAIFMSILLFLSGFDVCKDDFAMNVDCNEKSEPVILDQKSQFMVIAYRPLEIKFPLSIAGDPMGFNSSALIGSTV